MARRPPPRAAFPIMNDARPIDAPPHAALLRRRIASRDAVFGVVGLGHVGLPLAAAAAGAGLSTLGFDIDDATCAALMRGESHLRHFPSEGISGPVAAGRLRATTDVARLAEPDVLAICVPTPLTDAREPDLGPLTRAARDIAARLRPGQLVIVESTTYPGTTEEVVRPILEAGGLVCGHDVFLAFAPEREDPGNTAFGTRNTPKVVGGSCPEARRLARDLYGLFTDRVVTVSDTRTAEAVKLAENVFRAVNIALANELKDVLEPMGVDIWEVIEAAATKPFGYMPFHPGPGLGGHCIPVDPHYLAWKARAHGRAARVVELAAEINAAMPGRVADRVAEALARRGGTGVRGARILVLGVAYKRNVADVRESPALRIIERLEAMGAAADFHDPQVARLPALAAHPGLSGRAGVAWRDDLAAGYDAALVVTDHDAVDYRAVVRHAPLVVDTRNACRRAGASGANLVLA